MRTWFTADPHFDHARIITLSNRPFRDVTDMNETIVGNYNRHVKSDDVLYILGDFAWGDAQSIKYWRERINCKNIHYIWGNHDKILKSNRKLALSLFSSFEAEYTGSINGQYVHLYHFPILEWDQFYRDSWNLFGHVHNTRPHLAGFLGLDVGVDANNYLPISFEQIKDKMSKIKERAFYDI